MALVLKDRVLETCTSPGTGTITLLGAVTGYQAFSTVGNGNTCYYAIADQNGANWEVGIGTYSSGTLARTTVLSSSNAGSLTNFSTGSQNVFLTYPSERSVNLSSAALTSGRVAYATTDGLLTDSELSRSERLTELDIRNEKADAQKHMAWVAMFSMIVFTIVLFSPMLSDSRVQALADLLGLFYIAQAGVVGAYFGMTAWMSK